MSPNASLTRDESRTRNPIGGLYYARTVYSSVSPSDIDPISSEWKDLETSLPYCYRLVLRPPVGSVCICELTLRLLEPLGVYSKLQESLCAPMSRSA